MADLAQFTDKRAATFRGAVLAAGALVSAENPAAELVAVWRDAGLRMDYLYECVAVAHKLSGKTPAARNIKAASLIQRRQVHGQDLVQCACVATLKQVGQDRAGSLSTSTNVKLLE